MKRTTWIVATCFAVVITAFLVYAWAYDSDGGFNVWEQGTCSDGSGNYTDHCTISPGLKVSNLKEWYPTNSSNSSVCTYQIVNCREYYNTTCHQGACSFNASG